MFLASKKSIISGIMCVAALALILSAGPAMSQETYQLSTIEYPPIYQSKETPGKGYGIALDITAAAFEAVGKKVAYTFVPLTRSVKLEKKYVANVGSMNWFKNAKMMDKVDYTDLMITKFVLFYKKAKFPNGISFESPAELKKYKSIGNVKGSSTTKLAEKHGLKIDWARSLAGNFKKLRADRVECAISSDIAGLAAINELFPNEAGQYAYSLDGLIDVHVSVTFRKENKKVYDEFIKGLQIIAKNGKYLEILERYFGKGNIPPFVMDVLKSHQS